MSHVTPEMRRIMVMAKKAGKKTKEIAEFLGVRGKLYGNGIKEHIIREKKVLEINQENHIISIKK